MTSAVDAHFNSKDADYFLGGLKLLERRCKKCVEVGGDYI